LPDRKSSIKGADAASCDAGSSRGAARHTLLQAAETCLLRDGYAGLTTRAVAAAAGTPLSQIHYHFRSKQGLVLALLEHQNEKLLKRQVKTLGAEAPLSARWLQACDHLEEDLKSGYVRVLQEILAAGYSDANVAEAARHVLDGWFLLLTTVGAELQATVPALKSLQARDIATLVGLAFIGAETLTLIGMDLPIQPSLRAVGKALKTLEADDAS
jgi:AcrR family transcriptional regulator